MVRLSTDNEIYAMNAMGISLWEIGLPIFLFGIIAARIKGTQTDKTSTNSFQGGPGLYGK